MSSPANSLLRDLDKVCSLSEPQAFLIWQVRLIIHTQQCCKNECDQMLFLNLKNYFYFSKQ